MLNSLRKTSKSWGFDFIPAANATSTTDSRKPSVVPSTHDEQVDQPLNHTEGHVRKISSVELGDGGDTAVKKRRSSSHDA